jgi:hypothetical protein
MKPDLKVLVSNNPTPTLENSSQAFTDPEHRVMIKNSSTGSTQTKRSNSTSGQPKPIKGADKDIFM